MVNKLMNKFFITGLPRSRTAWLSTFFTGDNCFCYHEVIRISDSFDNAVEKMLNRKEMYVGNSDSSLPFWMNKIDHVLIHSPIVIIERDIDEATNSLVNTFGKYDYTKIIDLTLEGIENIKKRYNYITIDYNKLNEQACLEIIWDFCTPNIPFDKDKFEMLNTINISLHKDLYMRSLFNEDDDGIKLKQTMEKLNEYVNKK